MTTRTPPRPLGQLVARSRARLARIAGRRMLRHRALLILLGASTLGAARPLYWAVSLEEPLWLGAALALTITAVALGAGAAALIWLGRRGGPSELISARAIDEALGLREVVASGLAFERDRREGVLEALVRSDAEAATRPFDPKAAFALPSLRPRWRRLALAAALLTTVALIGSYHPALASILLAPPSEQEMASADELERLARELDRRDGRAEMSDEQRGAPDRVDTDGERRAAQDQTDHRELAQKAQQLARAARRGDRTRALRDLDELTRAGREATRESKALQDALRRLASALESRPAASGSGSRRSESTEESGASKSGRTEGAQSREARELSSQLSKLAEQLAAPEKTGREATDARRAALEALARAVAEAERAAQRSGRPSERATAQKLAEALTQAGQSLSKGQRAEAGQKLQEAISRAQKMEATRERLAQQAEALTKMLEAAGLLGESMQRALAQGQPGRRGELAKRGLAMGRQGQGGQGQGQGEGEGQGEGVGAPSSTDLARALALRMAALGLAGTGASGLPGQGREGSANNVRAPSKGLPVKGALRVRAVAPEGERAVTAIQGLGSATEPTRAYRDIYPAYSALAEESMAEERIPAAQRGVVQRYFESIRPGGAQERRRGGSSQ